MKDAKMYTCTKLSFLLPCSVLQYNENHGRFVFSNKQPLSPSSESIVNNSINKADQQCFGYEYLRSITIPYSDLWYAGFLSGVGIFK